MKQLYFIGILFTISLILLGLYSIVDTNNNLIIVGKKLDVLIGNPALSESLSSQNNIVYIASAGLELPKNKTLNDTFIKDAKDSDVKVKLKDGGVLFESDTHKTIKVKVLKADYISTTLKNNIESGWHMDDSGKLTVISIPFVTKGDYWEFDIELSSTCVGCYTGSYSQTFTNLTNTSTSTFSQILTNVSSLTANITDYATLSDPYAINTSGLVGWWHLDDNYTDISGNRYNGTIYGLPSPAFINGKFNNASNFDGVNDYIGIDTVNFLDSNQAGSVNIWFKRNNISQIDTLWMYSTTDDSFSFYELYVTSVSIILKTKTGSDDVTFTTNTVVDSNWHNIIVVSDNLTTKLYYDTVEKSLTMAGASNTGQWFADIPNIGVYNHYMNYGRWFRTTSAFYMNGSIDEVQIFNRSLNASEISALYYTHLQEQNLTATGNGTASGNWNGINPLSIPVASNNTIIGLTYTVPASVTINSIVVNDYNSSTKWNLTATAAVTENTTNITEFSASGYYHLNGSLKTGSNVTIGQSNITSINTNVTDYATLSDPYAINTNGLVGRWHFDESTGTIAEDSSGNNNNGTLYNMNPGLNNCTGNCSGWNSSGKYNTSLNFDGVNDSVDILTSSSLNSTRQLTVSAWIKLNKTTGLQSISSKFKSDQNGWYFLTDTTNLRMILYNTSLGNGDISRAAGLITNKWYHVTTTYDGSSIKLYLDGLQLGTSLSYSNLTQNVSDSVRIGSRLSTESTLFFNGSIDEVQIYNRSLNASEVAALYYTHLQELNITASGNGTASGLWNSTNNNNLSIPVKTSETITSLNYSVPTSVTINGIVVNDYRNSTMFNVSVIFSNTTKMNYTNSSYWNPSYVNPSLITLSINDPTFLTATYKGSATMTSNNANFTLGYFYPYLRISTGALNNSFTNTYNITIPYNNAPITSIDASTSFTTTQNATINTSASDPEGNTLSCYVKVNDVEKTSCSQNDFGTLSAGTYTIYFNVTEAATVSSQWVYITANLTISSSIAGNIPPTPTNFTNTTGNFWVNYTWEAGIGNVTDSYNVSLINNSIQYWINGSAQNWTNSTVGAHNWSNISVYAYNNSGTGTLNVTNVSANTQVANNAPVQAAIGSKTIDENSWLNFTINSTDTDNDILTYATNATKGTLSGYNYSWKPNISESGTYYFNFNTTDNYSAVSNNETVIVTVTNIDFIPPTPDIGSVTTGIFWINTTWVAGAGNITNSYNSTNGTAWINSSSNYRNTTLSPHAWQNLTIYAYNNSYGNLSETPLMNNTQIQNNVPEISVNNQAVNEGQTVFIQLNASDLDEDILVYSINRTDLFTDFNATTGKGNWTTNFTTAGIYYIDAGVQDNYYATANYTFVITINNLIMLPNITSYYNNISGWNNATAQINISNQGFFNVTINQTVNTISWKINGTEMQNTSSLNFTTWFNSTGYYNVSAQAYNANGSSNIIYTNVSVVEGGAVPPCCGGGGTDWDWAQGYVKYANGTAIEGVLVTTSVGTDTTDASGYFNFGYIFVHLSTYNFNGTKTGFNYNSTNYAFSSGDFTWANLTMSVSEPPVTPGTPNITSWNNTNTSNSNLTLYVNSGTNITFNVTANQTVDTWTWTGATIINGTGTNYSYAYLNVTTSVSVTVQGTNTNGSTQIITWNIIIPTATNLVLTGYVTNILELPLENARIDFNGTHVFTNASGGYNFTGITEGSYTVLARQIGYRNSTTTASILVNTTLNFTLKERTTAGVSTPGFSGISVIFMLFLIIYIRRIK